MKKFNTQILLLFLFVGSGLTAKGQSVMRSTLASAGSSQTVTANGKTYIVSQSIGQSSVGGTSSNGYVIRQGYQQPPYRIKVGKPSNSDDLSTNIYPNPFSQSVNIAFREEIKKDVTVRIVDVSGKLILTQNFAPSLLITLSLENIASGNYIINVSSGKKSATTTLLKK